MRANSAITMLLALCSVLAPAAQAEVRITDQTASHCWFSGQPLESRFAISGLDGRRAIAQYRLSAANHTIASSEAALKGSDSPALLTRSVTLPPLAPGVTVALQATIAVIDAESREQLAVTNVTFHSFSPDAFAPQKAQLTQLRIALFDPERSTLPVFEEFDIPYTFVRSLESVITSDAPSPGAVVIGEGVAPADFPELWGQLNQLTVRGIPVLCLALRGEDGDVLIHRGKTRGGVRGGLFSVESLILKRHSALSGLDKRFDTHSWGPTRRLASESLGSITETGNYLFRPDAKGWLWLEQTSTTGSAPVILCQFRIVEHWEASPVPRYMLLKLLEQVGYRKRITTEAHHEGNTP
jgi:hypothetical protein